MDPRLLLADEPTGNLDARTGKEIIDLIHLIRNDRSMTVLLATHDPAIAVRADRVIALSDGRRTADIEVRADETPESLLAKIATPVTER
jgi:putative ABC transport system ATP-binding protein